MKRNQRLLAIFVIFILAIYFSRQSMTEDEKYCSQYAGESNKNTPSQLYLACNNDKFCKTEDVGESGAYDEQKSDPDDFEFFCVPVGAEPSSSQGNVLFPK